MAALITNTCAPPGAPVHKLENKRIIRKRWRRKRQRRGRKYVEGLQSAEWKHGVGGKSSNKTAGELGKQQLKKQNMEKCFPQ